MQSERKVWHQTPRLISFHPGEGHGKPLRYFCLENPMDTRAWWAMVHRAAKSQTWLKPLSTHNITSAVSHWGFSGIWDSTLPLQRAQVWSLVKELRSKMLHCKKKYNYSLKKKPGLPLGKCRRRFCKSQILAIESSFLEWPLLCFLYSFNKCSSLASQGAKE